MHSSWTAQQLWVPVQYAHTYLCYVMLGNISPQRKVWLHVLYVCNNDCIRYYLLLLLCIPHGCVHCAWYVHVHTTGVEESPHERLMHSRGMINQKS